MKTLNGNKLLVFTAQHRFFYVLYNENMMTNTICIPTYTVVVIF